MSTELREYYQDWKAHKRKVKAKHDEAVDEFGLDKMRESIEKEGLEIQSDYDILKPRWRIFLGEKWIDFWPHTGTLYQPQKKIHEWISDWQTAGKVIKGFLTNL